MIDYNKEYKVGDYENGLINVVIEVPLKSTEKIEWSRDKKIMEVDRSEPSTFTEPVNYGFIPQTTGGDNDNLDVLVISDDAIPTGSILNAKVIGVMKFKDEDETDDKIVTVPIENNSINSLKDLSKQKIDEITYYFNHYKDYKKPGLTLVTGWGDIDEAKIIIELSIKRFNIEK